MMQEGWQHFLDTSVANLSMEPLSWSRRACSACLWDSRLSLSVRVAFAALAIIDFVTPGPRYTNLCYC
jgi:hypothetical protein